MLYLTQSLHQALQTNPDGVATVFARRRNSWRVFGDRVSRLAGALRGLGVKGGDRVAILALNSDRYVEYFYATLWLGAVAVPLNTRWSPVEIANAVEDSQPSILLFDDAFVERAEDLRLKGGSVRHFVNVGEQPAPPWALDYESLLRGAPRTPDTFTGGRAIAAIIYTGGTTGFPKGVQVTHEGVLWTAIAGATVLQPSRGEVFALVAPLFHLAALWTMFVNTMFAGTHAILPGFNAEKLIDLVAEERVTTVLLIPTMVKMLLDRHDEGGGDLGSLSTLLYGGSPISEALLDRARKALPTVRFFQPYGQTEMSSLVSLLTPQEHHGERLRSAGRAIPGLDVKIADDRGIELETGTVGEIWIRGPSTMAGYANKPEATAAALIDGWVRTGDAAYMDGEGFLYLVDRVKDMIISGGENVFSAEVENALASCPGVAECAVIGVPDEEWGERVHAVIVPLKGFDVTAASAIAHCREVIAGYKCPRSVEMRAEPLPLSAAGKVLKHELRAPHWQGRARNVS